MGKRLSLHIGVDALAPMHDGGWAGKLATGESDPGSMLETAQQRGFEAGSLITAQATCKRVFATLLRG